jgi:hypothetical protein
MSSGKQKDTGVPTPRRIAQLHHSHCIAPAPSPSLLSPQYPNEEPSIIQIQQVLYTVFDSGIFGPRPTPERMDAIKVRPPTPDARAALRSSLQQHRGEGCCQRGSDMQSWPERLNTHTNIQPCSPCMHAQKKRIPIEDYGFYMRMCTMGNHSLYKMEQRIMRMGTLNRAAVAAMLGYTGPGAAMYGGNILERAPPKPERPALPGPPSVQELGEAAQGGDTAIGECIACCCCSGGWRAALMV